MALLEIENMSTGYHGVPVVRNLHLQVNEGEVVALLGPNGAGKTTTLLTTSGINPILDGDIRLFGRSLKGRRPHLIAREGLAHVPEDRSLFFQLTVAENLRLGAARGAADIDQALGYFPALERLMDRKAGLLSGGEQQMLAMARAVMLNPEIVLLDEPSMGLAPILVEEVFRIISDLKSRGVTMLLVEQFAAAALKVADYGYVLENGRISVHGDAAKLRDDPAVKAAYLGGGGGH